MTGLRGLPDSVKPEEATVPVAVSKLDAIPTQAQRILVVDDEADIREALSDLLEATIPGVQVMLAASGEEGVEKIRDHEVDVIISDYRMPGMDGLEFLRHAMETRPQAARILITAYPQLSLAMDAINDAAIQNFFTKPLQPARVEEAVKAALIKSRMARQREAHFNERSRVSEGPF